MYGRNGLGRLRRGAGLFMLSAFSCMLFSACSPRQGESGEGDATATAATETEAPPKQSYGEMLRYETEFEQNAMPFWRTDVMYGECATMIRREDGQITAKLLFTPVRILEVRDVTRSTVYVEGKDYIWNEGTNTLSWVEGSAIPYFTDNDLAGRREDGSQITQWGDAEAGWDASKPFDELGRSRIGNALYSVSEFYYGKQIAVTYTYTYEDWQGAVTPYQGDLLPHTMAKLQAGERLRLTFYGDSIFTGCDSSKMYGRAPEQEYFSFLLKKMLEQQYNHRRIILSNPSKGGMDSAWGAENAGELVAQKNPDLVVIGFGMNDGGRTSAEFAANIRSIMDTVRASNPDCEFILVTPMVPNVQSGYLHIQGEILNEFRKMQGPGTAVVDMFGVHSDILQMKDYSATSGNNVNHPNDWLIRVYAMQLISCMVQV